VAQFRSQLAWMREFFGLWPDFVVQDLETRAGLLPRTGLGSGQAMRNA
jgi:hypothetical protein